MMLPITPHHKKIATCSFILAILGILSEYSNYFLDKLLSNIEIRYGIISIISPMNIFDSKFFSLRTYNEFGHSVNYVNILFYALLLLGAFLYTLSKQKETRLIRFVLSVMLIQSIVTIILRLAYFVLYLKLVFTGYYWIFGLLNIAKFALLIYLCQNILKKLSGTKVLQENYYHDQYGTLIYNPTDTSKWQRFFHFIIDTLICFSVLIPFLLLLSESFLKGIEDRDAAYFVLFLMLLVARTIYYPFFEIFFGATPAKFLTESRVVRNDGGLLSKGRIIKRTFCRYIPFEPFSFFGSLGWHDNFSDTLVIKEQRTGVKAVTYLLVIPAFAVIGALCYFGVKKINDHQYELKQMAEYDAKRNELKMGLSKLSTSDIIRLEEVPYSYSPEKTTLKVEGINGNDIKVSIMKMSNGDTYSLVAVDDFYKKNKDTFDIAIINKTALEKAILADYNSSLEKEKHGVDLLSDGKKYIIKSINRLYAPYISSDGYFSSSKDELNIRFINQGWPTKIVSLENMEGNIKWDNPLPMQVPSAINGDYPGFVFHGKNYEHGQEYKFKITTAADSSYSRQVYLIEGTDYKITIKRLE